MQARRRFGDITTVLDSHVEVRRLMGRTQFLAWTNEKCSVQEEGKKTISRYCALLGHHTSGVRGFYRDALEEITEIAH